MTITVLAAALHGLNMHPVHVVASVVREHDAPLSVSGLSEVANRGTRIRVRSALENIGIGTATIGIATTIMLAPGEPSRPTGADLAMAVATIVRGMSSERRAGLETTMFVGDLGFDGRIQPVRGILPILLGAKARGITTVVVSSGSAAEAVAAMTSPMLAGVDVQLANNLSEVVSWLRDEMSLISPSPAFARQRPDAMSDADMSDVAGQSRAKRALEVAAAGDHSILLVGPPGAGKTMLARRLPGILPLMTPEEAIEAASIRSVAGLFNGASTTTIGARPFRAPHYSVSEAALRVGGSPPRPGEISLAHLGVLYLDEVGEFRKSAVEGFRHSLSDGRVRLGGDASFPCRALVVGSCVPDQVERATRIFDFDIIAHVERNTVADLSKPFDAPTSATIRERVTMAREVARSTAHLTDVPDSNLGRVARTIAHLDGEADTKLRHLEEATTFTARENSK